MVIFVPPLSHRTRTALSFWDLFPLLQGSKPPPSTNLFSMLYQFKQSYFSSFSAPSMSQNSDILFHPLCSKVLGLLTHVCTSFPLCERACLGFLRTISLRGDKPLKSYLQRKSWEGSDKWQWHGMKGQEQGWWFLWCRTVPGKGHNCIRADNNLFPIWPMGCCQDQKR